MSNPNITGQTGQPDPNRLLQMLAAKTGQDPKKLQQQLAQGNAAGLLERMDPASRATAEKVIADPSLAQKMLQTPQIREMIGRLMGGGK